MKKKKAPKKYSTPTSDEIMNTINRLTRIYRPGTFPVKLPAIKPIRFSAV